LSPRQELATAGALLAAKGLLLGLTLRAGFVGLSGDDWFRMLIMHAWARRPFVASTEFGGASFLWLPLPFWMGGTLLRWTGDIYWTAVGLNVVAGLITILLVGWLGRSLFGPMAGWVAAALVASLRWHTWLSLSAMAEPVFLCFLLLAARALVGWARTGRQGWLLLGAAALLFSNMVRFEGWIFTAAFTLVASLGCGRAGRFPDWRTLGILVVPWLFPAAWCGFNYVATGDLFFFLRFVPLASETRDIPGGFTRLAQYPFLIALVSPVLSLLLLPAAWQAGRRGDRSVRSFLGFATLAIVGLVLANVAGAGTEAIPQRYGVVVLVLGVPLVAGCLVRIAAGPWRWVMAVGAVLFVAGNIVLTFQVPTAHVEAVQVGRLLREAFERGALPPSVRVASEWSLQDALDRVGDLAPLQTLFWDESAAIRVFSNHPERFLGTDLDDPRLRPSRRSASLKTLLVSENIRVLVLRSPELLQELPPGFAPLGIVGGAILVADAGLREALPALPPATVERPIRIIADRLAILDVRWEPPARPQTIQVIWRPLSGFPTEGGLLEVELIGRDGMRLPPLTVPLSRDAAIRFPGAIWVTIVPLTKGKPVPAGAYSTRIRIAWAQEAQVAAAEAILTMEERLLGHSLRGVLKAWLRGDQVPTRLLWWATAQMVAI